METVKVRAYKKLGPTGKVENVDAHLRKVQKQMIALGRKFHLKASMPTVKQKALIALGRGFRD